MTSDTCVGDDVSIGGLLSGELEVGKGLSGLRRQLATTSTHQLSPPATKQEMEKVNMFLFIALEIPSLYRHIEL